MISYERKVKQVDVRFIRDEDVKSFIKDIRTERINKGKKEENKLSNIVGTPINGRKHSRSEGLIDENGREKSSRNHEVTPRKAKKLQAKYAEIESGTESGSDSSTASASKPTALFEDGDIDGRHIFGFQTPKRKNAMAQKALHSASKEISPKTPNTPNYRIVSSRDARSIRAGEQVAEILKRKSANTTTPNAKRISTPLKTAKTPVRTTETANSGQPSPPVTPYLLRKRVKQAISQRVALEEEGLASEAIDSDYEADSSESSDSEESAEESAVPLETTPKVSVKLPATPVSRPRRKNANYVFGSDAYFESQSGKAVTSDRTLSRLGVAPLEHSRLSQLLNGVKPAHKSALAALSHEHASLFRRWKFMLKQGFSLLFYGLGSKRNLLNTFRSQVLQDSRVLVVNGFFPGLTIKEVVDKVASELLGMRTVPGHLPSAIEAIEHRLTKQVMGRVFLIVHNLDGAMLRADRAQTAMAHLARISRLHLIASIDHINCPLLWDRKKLADYNFAWVDGTSYLPYTEETSFESSLMVQRSGRLALAALSNVFRSLTNNAKKIFRLLLAHQINHKSTQQYNGVAFSELYRWCRNEFLVSSDLALRTQLTEFLDHELVRWRRDTDNLVIPIETGILRQFSAQLNQEE